MTNTSNNAVDTASSFMRGVDMSGRERKILKDVSIKANIQVGNTIWKSTYYNSGQIGATLYQGVWEGKEVILKIQGVKPEVSEIYMVNSFDNQNGSKIVRPPKFFLTLPWNEELDYEAIIMEKVTGKKVIDSKQLQTKNTLDKFFGYYLEYKRNCVKQPWIGSSTELHIGESEQQKTKAMVAKLKPDSSLRLEGDVLLADIVTDVLNKEWLGKKSEFMHGHFSAEDLIYQGEQVVLFSNLFWKWKHRFYDAIFAYHYCMIGLSQIKGVNKEVFDSQRKLWLDKIYGLPLIESEDDKRMINVALLERMLACLLIDGIMFVNESSEVADHLIGTTRSEIGRLLEALK